MHESEGALKLRDLNNIFAVKGIASYLKLLFHVIPASEARRESFFLRKDSGQAGMTEKLCMQR